MIHRMNKNDIKKFLQYCIGIMLSGMGIALCYYTQLGTDPLSVFIDGVHNVIGSTYGEATFLINILLCIFLFVFNRKSINLGLLLACILPGFFLDMFFGIFREILPSNPPQMVNVLIMFVSVIICSLGVSIYIHAKIGAAPVDSIHLFIIDRFNIRYKFVRLASDIIFLTFGFLLGGVVGIGTIISLCFFGILTDFFLSRLN